MKRIAVLAALLLAACGSGSGAPQLASSRSFTVLPPSWDCSTYSYYLGRNIGNESFVVTPVVAGEFGPMDDNGDTVTLSSSDGIVWDWTSTALIRAVLVRADLPGTALGDATNQIWLYAGPDGGGSYGSVVYTEDSSNQRYPAKYIDFCFDAPPPRLQIVKTAVPEYTASFEWTIAKSAGVDSLVLASGQAEPVAYHVALTKSAASDSGWMAHGEVTVTNPGATAVTITSITDTMDVPATLDCPVTFPSSLAAGATLVCSWTVTLPDAGQRLNTVTVVADPASVGGTATTLIDFTGVPPTNTVDACVDVVDDRLGALGTACESMTFDYALDVSFEECGDHSFDNTASFVAATTGTAGSATHTLPVTVACDEGCTLTPGYWKTHSIYGPAPYDATWALVGEDTAFFMSGQTWYSQFWVAPAGNAYWNLSHQYAAAALNVLNGSAAGAVQSTMDAALVLLQTYTPANVKASSALRGQFVAAGSVLDAYNNGVVGPGHCDE